MKELEKIRNAARVLNVFYQQDMENFLFQNSVGSINKKRAEMIETRLVQFATQLQQIQNALNEIAPFEIAADRHLRNTPTGINSVTYQQIFDRERLREKHLRR